MKSITFFFYISNKEKGKQNSNQLGVIELFQFNLVSLTKRRAARYFTHLLQITSSFPTVWIKPHHRIGD